MSASKIAAQFRLLTWGAVQVARLGRPAIALGFLGGIGDDLLCTAPIEEWRRRRAGRIWFFSRHHGLHRSLGSPVKLIPDDPRYQRLAIRLGCPMRPLSYSTYDPAIDRDTALSEHLIASMCRRAGLRGTVRLRPHLNLSGSEQAEARRWNGWLAMQSGGLAAAVPMQNKQWRPDHFQELATQLLAQGARIVQVGATSDARLEGTTDLRGRTDLRQTATVLAGARLLVGLSGFLMHLARAVETPSVIVYGGREPPELTGYSCNLNVDDRPACAPCWQRNRCDFGHTCMQAISVSQVLAAVQQALARPRGPLAEDLAEL